MSGNSNTRLDGADFRQRRNPLLRRDTLCGTVAGEFDADTSVDDVEFLHPDRDGDHARVREQGIRDLFRQCLDERDMAARKDQPNGIDDDVVGKYVAYILRLAPGSALSRRRC